ncbi:MAG TPA: amylo-alpha-1,6-glucosidase [Candidatus Saccharimonadales bacterium]|nr:amylo-alpha-1,6-glucosidase [Candidatus Saccharimonadales bacterium]
MKNYDSVDATSLYLIAVYRYFQASLDKEFLDLVLDNVEQALSWTFVHADSNDDGFIDYFLKKERQSGGLVNQNWMDSTEASFHEDGTKVVYPLAPVEAQAYNYLALRLWGRFYKYLKPAYARRLTSSAKRLKTNFNKNFVIKDEESLYLAAALDRKGKPLRSVRSSMGHCLWASLNLTDDREIEGIVEQKDVDSIVKRLLKEDLFEREAGIRTLSKKSVSYKANSYHNGSIWPHDNSMIAEGLENYGYFTEAALVKKSILKAWAHFKTPVELYVFDETLKEYRSTQGQESCKTQAWSAAAILNSVAPEYASSKRRHLLKLEFLTTDALKRLFVYNNLFLEFNSRLKGELK